MERGSSAHPERPQGPHDTRLRSAMLGPAWPGRSPHILLDCSISYILKQNWTINSLASSPAAFVAVRGALRDARMRRFRRTGSNLMQWRDVWTAILALGFAA